MGTDEIDTLLATVRSRHTRRMDGHGCTMYLCSGAWPCEPSRLADAYDRLRAAVPPAAHVACAVRKAKVEAWDEGQSAEDCHGTFEPDNPYRHAQRVAPVEPTPAAGVCCGFPKPQQDIRYRDPLWFCANCQSILNDIPGPTPAAEPDADPPPWVVVAHLPAAKYDVIWNEGGWDVYADSEAGGWGGPGPEPEAADTPAPHGYLPRSARCSCAEPGCYAYADHGVHQ